MSQIQTPKPAANGPPKETGLAERTISFKPFLSDKEITLSPAMIVKFIAKPTKTGKPCTIEQAVRFMMLCQARGLNPWEGDAFLVGYDSQNGPEFNLITAHVAFLKRAEVHKEFKGMESGVVVVRTKPEVKLEGGLVVPAEKVIEQYEGDFVIPGDILVGGWARVHKDGKLPVYRRLRLDTYNSGYSRWKADPAGMIVKCAEADALRSAFPNALGGMYLEEETDREPERTEPKTINRLAERVKAAQQQVAVPVILDAPQVEPEQAEDKPDFEPPAKASPDKIIEAEARASDAKLTWPKLKKQFPNVFADHDAAGFSDLSELQCDMLLELMGEQP